MGFIVSAAWVKEHKPVIVDVRFQLQNSEFGYKAYKQGHIEGAFYLDLNQDLSGEPAKHGGNHPLPDVEVFAKKLGDIGIDRQTPVVFYDAANDMYAGRAWWMLHYFGHEAVYVLDGGFAAWEAAGNKVTQEVPEARAVNFVPNILPTATATMAEVRASVDNPQAIVIDSRAPERYTGEVEPMYNKRGHIPGAKNYFFKGVLDDAGKYKTEASLREHFAGLDKKSEIIVSCGSGVSACPNIIGLKTAGFENVKLYVGSFSDWISYDDNTVELGEK